ncbi:MAG: hypothetical protein ACD_33C00015G0005, partial [uncultured bacterium]
VPTDPANFNVPDYSTFDTAAPNLYHYIKQ